MNRFVHFLFIFFLNRQSFKEAKKQTLHTKPLTETFQYIIIYQPKNRPKKNQCIVFLPPPDWAMDGPFLFFCVVI